MVGRAWDPEVVNEDMPMTVWDRLREYAATQSGPFTPQEAISWFRRHASAQANDRTVRTHIRGACWNVRDRSQFSNREPFLTRVDRGVFRAATAAEIVHWRRDRRGEDAPPGAQTEVEPEVVPAAVTTMRGNGESEARQVGATAFQSEWHTEANVQAHLVTSLATDGWRILSVANTATKEHGIDVIASREGGTVGIEVKGFPSRTYADPGRAGQRKRTSPSTQAAHWYAQAVLAAMRLRGREPEWHSVIALPDFPRYRALHSETAGSLAAAAIEVWWVDAQGRVDRP